MNLVEGRVEDDISGELPLAAPLLTLEIFKQALLLDKKVDARVRPNDSVNVNCD